MQASFIILAVWSLVVLGIGYALGKKSINRDKVYSEYRNKLRQYYGFEVPSFYDLDEEDEETLI